MSPRPSGHSEDTFLEDFQPHLDEFEPWLAEEGLDQAPL